MQSTSCRRCQSAFRLQSGRAACCRFQRSPCCCVVEDGSISVGYVSCSNWPSPRFSTPTRTVHFCCVMQNFVPLFIVSVERCQFFLCASQYKCAYAHNKSFLLCVSPRCHIYRDGGANYQTFSVCACCSPSPPKNITRAPMNNFFAIPYTQTHQSRGRVKTRNWADRKSICNLVLDFQSYRKSQKFWRR